MMNSNMDNNSEQDNDVELDVDTEKKAEEHLKMLQDCLSGTGVDILDFVKEHMDDTGASEENAEPDQGAAEENAEGESDNSGPSPKKALIIAMLKSKMKPKE